MLLQIWDFCLDTIAPPDPYIRDIERKGYAHFSANSQRPDPKDSIEGITCLFSYRDERVKRAVLEVKSYGNARIAYLIGRTVYDELIAALSEEELFSDFSHPVLVPVPMTRKCLQKRGWNQCELIAEGIYRADRAGSIEYRASVIKKIRETKDQVGQTRTQRFENLKGCFRATDAVKGRNVIVLDDIATTGATLFEARRALLAAGAKRVLLVSVAH